jgi:hypothetical protein
MIFHTRRGRRRSSNLREEALTSSKSLCMGQSLTLRSKNTLRVKRVKIIYKLIISDKIHDLRLIQFLNRVKKDKVYDDDENYGNRSVQNVSL